MPTMPPTFRPHGYLGKQARQRQHDARRGTAHQRGYTKKLRNAMDSFKLSHPLCLGCQAVGRVTATEVTDHTIPAKGDVALLWNSANFQPACRWHHDVVKQKLEAQFAAGEINVEDLRLDSPRAIALTKSNDLG